MPAYYFNSAAADNSGDGQTTGTAKKDWTGFSLSSLNGSTDSINLARGSTWTNLSMNYGGPTTTATTPLVIQAYGSGAKPILAFNSDPFVAINLEGNAFVLQNIRLEDTSNGSNDTGVQVLVGKTRLDLIGVEISGFYTGVDLQVDVGGSLSSGVTIRGCLIENQRGFGVLGGASNSLIEDNTFQNNIVGNATGLRHVMYFTSPYATMRNAHLRRNLFLGNSVNSGVAGGGQFTCHGAIDGLIFEDNYINPGTTDSDFNSYGVSLTPGYNTSLVAEGFNHVIIRRNTIVNTTIGIGGSSILNSLFEANHVIYTAASNTAGAVWGFLFPNGAYDGGAGGHDQISLNNTFQSNTVDISAAGALGMDFSRRAGNSPPTGDAWLGVNSVISSNAIRLRSTGYCFAVPTPSANFTITNADKNSCYGGTGVNSGDANVGAFESRTSFTNTVTTDPLLTTPTSVNSYLCSVSSGSSPLVNAANTTYRSRLAKSGTTASSARDIGASEYVP